MAYVRRSQRPIAHVRRLRPKTFRARRSEQDLSGRAASPVAAVVRAHG